MNIFDTIQIFKQLQRDLSHSDFIEIFIKDFKASGVHYWYQFSITYNHNLLLFLLYLGKTDTEKFCERLDELGYINKYIE